MIIRINNKKHDIKSTNTLTCNEYLNILQIEKFGLIDYLSLSTGYSNKSLMKAKIKQTHLNTIAEGIGKIKNLDSFFLIKKLPQEIEIAGKTYNYNKLKDLTESVGARLLLTQFEQSKDKKRFESIIYFLAIILDGSMDSESINQTFEDLLKENYIECFKIACFFLRRFQRQLSKEMNFLKRLKSKTLTKIAAYGKRPA